MSAAITITTTFDATHRIFTCTVNNGADIPSDIFLYENNDGVPGAFFAVCSLSDYQRYKTYTGTPIPIFANKYIKQTSGVKILDINDDYSEVIPVMVDNCKTFRAAYLGFNTPSSATYTL